MSTDSRDAILARIREALREPAPLPGHHGAVPTEDPALHTPGEFSQWLPGVGPDFASQSELFARNSAELKTEFHLVDSEADLTARLVQLARESGWKRVATHGGALTDCAVPALGLPTLQTDGGYATADLEPCDAGITQCDALVAQTGSVLITALSAGGRALSVLPPHHVVLARASQMVANLPAAYAVLRDRYREGFPSFMSFITGPSRTGDIERILVLGAHGPKRLTILCTTDS